MWVCDEEIGDWRGKDHKIVLKIVLAQELQRVSQVRPADKSERAATDPNDPVNSKCSHVEERVRFVLCVKITSSHGLFRRARARGFCVWNLA